MDLSKIKEHIKDNEGFRDHVYLDHLGFRTVGWGKLVENTNLKVGDKVPMKQLEEWFDESFNEALETAKWFLNNSYNEKELLVTVDMSYNLGKPRLSKFVKFRAAINSKDYIQAAMQIKNSRYYTQVTNRADRNINILLGE